MTYECKNKITRHVANRKYLNKLYNSMNEKLATTENKDYLKFLMYFNIKSYHKEVINDKIINEIIDVMDKDLLGIMGYHKKQFIKMEKANII